MKKKKIYNCLTLFVIHVNIKQITYKIKMREKLIKKGDSLKKNFNFFSQKLLGNIQ